MTWRDKLEIGLKEDAPFRKDNLPERQVRGPEIPSGPGRSPVIPAAKEEAEAQPPPPAPEPDEESTKRAGIASIAEGIEAFREAQKRHNSWFSRFLLGKAYVETDHFAEAFAELELCVKRRGETADVFFNDMPTLHYLPEVYYWLGRAQDGVGSKGEAQKSSEQFLNVRPEAKPPDPLMADA